MEKSSTDVENRPAQSLADGVELKTAPTHYCVACAAHWIKWADSSWTLASENCGPCCDNVSMTDAPIIPVAYKHCVEPDWRSIESAPKDGSYALFYAAGNPHALIKRARLKERIVIDHWSSKFRGFALQLPEAPYSHWMPRPAPPRTTGASQ